ncbi:hypothetical protein YPPY88_0431, partial [Yersinia pestis PY-88]
MACRADPEVAVRS